MKNQINENDKNQEQETPSPPVSLMTKICYVFGGISANIVFTPIIFLFIPYAQHMKGLSGHLTSVVLNIGHVWDAINDPLIGIAIAKTRTRFGQTSHGC